MFSLKISKPFAASIWATIIMTVCLIAYLLRFFSKYECIEFKSSSAFLLSLGAFCQQGTYHKISMLSTRCLLAFLFVTSVLAYNFYTSVLVSHLVDMKYESNIDSMDDLTEKDIPVGFFNSTETRNFLNVRTLFS